MQTLIISNTSNELLRVHANDIIYVEADSNYCQMHLKGEVKQDIWFNMKHFSELVDEQMKDEEPIFIGVGRSLVINRLYIYRINPSKGELILYGNGCEKMLCLHASVAALSQLKTFIQNQKNTKSNSL